MNNSHKENTTNSSYKLASWQLDVAAQTLSKGEKTVELPAKIAAVLAFLLENKQRVVLRDELIDKVWDGNHYVGQKGLTNAIWRLRKILADDPEIEIRTVSKSGYQVLFDEAVTSSKQAKIKLSKLILLVVMTMLALASHLLISSKTKTEFPSFASPIALAYQQNEERLHAVSPDGELMSYVISELDNSQSSLYVRSIADETNIKLVDQSADLYGAGTWSADGTWLYSLVVNHQPEYQCQIVRFNLLTGNKQELVSCDSHVTNSLSLSHDDRMLWYSNYNLDSEIGGIYSLDMETKTSTAVIEEQTSVYFAEQVLCPMSEQSIVVLVREKLNSWQLFEKTLEGKTIRKLNDKQWNISGIHCDSKRRTVLISEPNQERHDIWQLNLDTPEQPRKLITEQAYTRPMLANAGLLANIHQLNTSVVQYSLQVQEGEAAAEQKIKLDISIGNSKFPAISPDNRYLAYLSDRSGSWQLWLRDLENKKERPITTGEITDVLVPSWSMDSQKIAFIAKPNAAQVQRQIYIWHKDSDELQQLTKDKQNYWRPSWRADGQALYATKKHQQVWQLWQFPINGDAGSVVVADKLENGLAEPSGRYVYFSKEFDGIWRLDDHTLVSDKFIDYLEMHDWGNWSVTAAGVYYLKRGKESDQVWLKTHQGRSKLVRKFNKGEIDGGYAWSINEAEQQLYVTSVDKSAVDIHLIPYQ